jgi:hypothetical protein
MRLFNEASSLSWMGLLATILLGTSTVQAMELDLDDEGGSCYLAASFTSVANWNLKTRSKR